MTFDEFWSQYPRKRCRREAEKSWNRLTVAEQQLALTALPSHIRDWAQTELRFIPHATTWLNQARWEDEIEPVQHKVTAWWTTERATLEYGAAKGLPAKPGEDMASYRARLRAA